MESTSPLVPFPQIRAGPDYEYRPCTIPYRLSSDPPKAATPTELVWIQLFRKSIPTFKKKAEADDSVADAPARAAKFAKTFGEILDDLQADPQSHGGPPDAVLFCRLRELCLRELGFADVYRKVKDAENVKSLALLEGVVAIADKIEDRGERIEHLVKGVFAGNIFDLGSTELAERYEAEGCSYKESVKQLLPRPWVVDDLDAFKAKWLRKPWKKAVIFVDNAGADVILGILPFARELLRGGAQVILAANDLPAINDITYEEMVQIISKVKKVEGNQETFLGVDARNLLVINSGSDLPVIDLSNISSELAYATEDVDLVVLEGMGRGIETNLNAQFKCDSVKLGMVKHPEVAEFLGGRLYDCVIRYTDVSL